MKWRCSQRGTAVKTLTGYVNGPGSTLPWRNFLFHFLLSLFFFCFCFVLFFFYTFFNVLSVLGVPNSPKKFRFPTKKLSNTDSHTIAAICGDIYCFRPLRTRRIKPAEFLSCSLPCSFPRSHAAVLGIPLIKYTMSLSLQGGGRHIGVTPPPPPPSSERPANYTAGHVDHEKRNAWVS